MTNIILFICMYPILLILYFVYKNQGKSQLHMLFGIRYSQKWLPDDERELLETNYRRSMNRFLLQYSLLPIITLFIPYISINISFWMLWMTVVIVMSMVPYYKANRNLLALKKERCGHSAETFDVHAELKQAVTIRRVKWQSFAFPVVISTLLAAFSILYFYHLQLTVWGITIAVFASCTLVFYIIAICTDRLKTKAISRNSDMNVNYAKAVKNIYKDFWLYSSWLNTTYVATTFFILTITHSSASFTAGVILWGAVIYTVIELFLCMKMINKQQTLSKQYESEMDFISDEEEEHWIGGMFYYNPKNKNSTIDHPMGTGTTVNMATPAGKITCAFTGLVFLSFPILCLWLILEEFTPISLSVKDDILIARHLKNDYVIATDAITELTLEDELPKVSRTNGSSMENLKKGNYRNSEDGKIKILLNPQNQYYLRVISNDTVYYLGGYDDTETLAVYDLLTNN